MTSALGFATAVAGALALACGCDSSGSVVAAAPADGGADTAAVETAASYTLQFGPIQIKRGRGHQCLVLRLGNTARSTSGRSTTSSARRRTT